MKHFTYLLLFSFIFIFSCTTDGVESTDPSLGITLINDVNLTSKALLRSPNQSINTNQTDDSFIRGTRVTLPNNFISETVEVPAGGWVTIAFSLQDIINEGPCQGNLSNDQINTIMEDAMLFIEEFGFELYFDGDQIDVFSNLRKNKIVTVTNFSGDCYSILPFRYYVNPQSIGEHTFTTNLDGVQYSRNINWVTRSN